MRELGWAGFGLWAAHEAVKDDTIFDDVNYQRKADGTLLLDCEDHACRFRAITVAFVQEDKCVVCFGDNNKKNGLQCMHFVTCSECWPKLRRCPLCRKRKL